MATTITKKAAKPQPQPEPKPGEYTWQQAIFSHMWMVYCVSYPKAYGGPQEYLEKLGTTSVKTVLATETAKKLIGKWELVWGVNVFQRRFSIVADATLYIAKYQDENSDISRYVISVAGTNPFSISTVLLEDARFASIRKWNEGEPWNSKMDAEYSDEPAVSAGLSLALKVHMVKMKDAEGNNLVQKLTQIVSQETKPVEITVAGHSLGGTVSPLIGLALLECQSKWDTKNIATVKVVSVAGMSPGNEAFAEYYQSKIGDRTERIWCDKDIVPRMATVGGLKTIASLYEPDVSDNIIVNGVMEYLLKTTEQHKYAYITKQLPYAGKFDPSQLVENVNKNEYLKQYVVTECSTLIYLVWTRQLEMIPFMPNFVEDKFEDVAESASDKLGVVISEMLGKAGNVDAKLENVFSQIVNSVSTIPLIGVFAQFNSNLLSSASIFGLIDYYLQFAYQHTEQYVDYFGFVELDNLRQKTTEEINTAYDEQNVRKQIRNTILVEYGKAKKDEIKDLFNGTGKLLDKISDVVTDLKQSGEVDENVQPLLFIIEKEKERGLFG